MIYFVLAIFCLGLCRRQLDTATSLAEEFLEFPLLVRICEESNQQSKLLNYMEMFSKENFAEFVFQVSLLQHGRNYYSDMWMINYEKV